MSMLSYSQGETSGQLQLSSENKSNPSGACTGSSAKKRQRSTQKSSPSHSDKVVKKLKTTLVDSLSSTSIESTHLDVSPSTSKVSTGDKEATQRQMTTQTSLPSTKVISRCYIGKKSGVSSFSKAINIEECMLFESATTLVKVSCANKLTKPYNLHEIAEHLKLQREVQTIKRDRNSNKSERSASRILKSIIGDGYTYKFNYEIPSVYKSIPILYTNTKAKPDVTVYKDSQLVFILEVQSTSMENTLKQCILRGSTLLRYYRLFNRKFNNLVLFAFPSLDSCSCIVKVKLTFQDLSMVYDLHCYERIDDGIEAIKQEFNDQLQRIPSCVERISSNFIELTPSEIQQICECDSEGCEQQQAYNAILICCKKGDMYKVVYLTKHKENILYAILKLQSKAPEHVICPQILCNNSYLLYKYKRVRYSPLTFDEAKKCLQGFVVSLMTALEELHSLGLAHYDVRLPNICFNEKYEAVLIDLDFCQSIKKNHSRHDDDSCLYRIDPNCSSQFETSTLEPGRKVDYMQVGWLIAYILHHELDEHKREWEKEPNFIHSNLMISKLVRSFEYDQTLLSQLPSHLSLEDVLEERRH